MRFIKNKQVKFTNFSAQRLIGIAMSFAPISSLVAISNFIVLLFAALLKEIEITVSTNNISFISHSR